MELNTKLVYDKHTLPIAPFFNGENDRDRVLSATYAVFQTTLDDGPKWLVSYQGKNVVAIHKDVIDQEKKSRNYSTIAKKGADARWEPHNVLSGYSLKSTWKTKEPVKLVSNCDWQSTKLEDWKTDLRDKLGIQPSLYEADSTFSKAGEMMQKALLGHLFDRVSSCNADLAKIELPGKLPIWQQTDDKTEEKFEAILDHYQIPQALRTVVKYDGVISLATRLNTLGEGGKEALKWIYSSSYGSAHNITHLWKFTSGQDVTLFPPLFQETE